MARRQDGGAYQQYFVAYFSGLNPYQLFSEFITALSATINFIERKRRDHAHHVAALSYHLGLYTRRLDPQELREVFFAGLLHDIGEIGIFDYILDKKGKLNQAERRLLAQHSRVGARIVQQLPTLQEAARFVLHHHERWDGLGYPDRLIHDATPLGAQIIALCDAFDVVLNLRFKEEKPDKALALTLEELHRFAGLQFNPWLVELMERMISEQGLERLIQIHEEDQLIIEILTIEHPEFGYFMEHYLEILLDFFNIVLEAKHRGTAAHCHRVAELCRVMGEHLGLPTISIETLMIAGRLHDIGKIALPHRLLEPGALMTDEEMGQFRQHLNYAVQILHHISGFGPVVKLIEADPDGREGMPVSADGKPNLAGILRAANLWDEIVSYPHLNRLSRILETTVPIPERLTELEARVIERVLA